MPNQSQKPVDIGGQAVLEGVMMKGPDAIAITVRRPDKTMVVDYKKSEPLSKKHKWMGLPIIRGAVNMVNMLAMGMTTLETSAKMLGTEEEEPTKFEKWLAAKLGKSIDKVVMGVAMVLAVLLSVGLFIVLPSLAEKGILSLGASGTVATLIGGLTKVLILIAYMIFCGMVPDVRRTFQYHGAEHKTVYCHEHNLPLTPKNAQQFTTLHPRCGTAFLLIVMLISIILFLFVGRDITNAALRMLVHLCLLPVVAGVSYEVLKGLAHSESKIAKILRWPGLQLQRLTTRQPDDGMLDRFHERRTVWAAGGRAAHGRGLGDSDLLRAERAGLRFPAEGRGQAVNPRALLKATASAFRDAGIPDPEVDAALLLSHVTGQPPLSLRLDMTTVLSADVLTRFGVLVSRRLTRQPLQYLLHTQPFLGRDFYVDERVLIPRPETELLAERAIAALREHLHPVALDLCCGSGALAVSMALEVPGAQVHAADLSPDALAVTAKNAELLGASVTLHQGDLFAAVPEIAFDVIVSNPPYIPSADCLTLQEEVRREPMMALDGGADGLDFYRRIASDAPKFLRPGGVLLLEVGFDQAEAVMALLADFADVQAHEDYQHIPRMIEARKHV